MGNGRLNEVKFVYARGGPFSVEALEYIFKPVLKKETKQKKIELYQIEGCEL